MLEPAAVCSGFNTVPQKNNMQFLVFGKFAGRKGQPTRCRQALCRFATAPIRYVRDGKLFRAQKLALTEEHISAGRRTRLRNSFPCLAVNKFMAAEIRYARRVGKHNPLAFPYPILSLFIF